MSLRPLALRPAIDTRPPAQPWVGPSEPNRLVPPNQPTLHLLLTADSAEPATAAGRLATAPVPSKVPVTVDVVPAGADPGHQHLLVDQARTWAPWYGQLLVEAVEGRRPLESLGRWLDEWVLAEVSRRVRLQRRTRSPRAAAQTRTGVISLRAQFTHPRVLEVAMHLRRGPRSAAWAFQLIRVGERWRCAALVLDPLPLSLNHPLS